MKKSKLVNAFSTVMQENIEKKNKWWEEHGLFIKLDHEVEELWVVLDEGSAEAIKSKAACVANVAMMIAGQEDPKWRKFRND